MKLRFYHLAIGLLSALCVIHAFGQDPPETDASQPDFSAVATAVEQFRHGAELNLRLHIGATRFSLSREVTTLITETEAEEALKNAKSVSPGIRFTKSKELVTYELEGNTRIENETGAKPQKWTRVTMKPIAAYPLSAWTDFMEFDLRNGMSELTVWRAGDAYIGDLSFASIGPHSLNYHGGILSLSESFYDNMRVSPDYPLRAGSSGFVILVHDPHQDVDGRFRLIDGLSSLFEANPQTKFTFLVEGAYPETQGKSRLNALFAPESRSISDGDLHVYLAHKPEQEREVIVKSMLRRFLIDTPLAFQLLNPVGTSIAAQLSNSTTVPIHGLAIDDNRYLKEYSAPSAERDTIYSALADLEKAASPPSTPAKEKFIEFLEVTRALFDAEPDKLSDVQLIKHYDELKDRFDKLSKVASDLSTSSPGFSADATTFSKQSAYFAAQVVTFQNALERNKTMLHFIEDAAHSSGTHLPLAFIGSYHTQGITQSLTEANIGYIVIEPRRHTFYNRVKWDDEQFNKFLQGPDAYFRSVYGANKGLCSLTEQQVQTTHIPFGTHTEFEMKSRFSAINGTAATGKIDSNRMRLAIASNGWLTETRVEVRGSGSTEAPGGPPGDGGGGNGTVGSISAGGGGGQKPPPKIPRGAFAFFDESGSKPILVLLDKDNDRWTDEARYARLGDAMFAIPYGDKHLTPVMHFARHSRDSISGREYASVYEAKSNRVYLIEGDVPRIASVLTLSSVRERGSVNVHIQVGEILEGGADVEQPRDSTNPDASRILGN